MLSVPAWYYSICSFLLVCVAICCYSLSVFVVIRWYLLLCTPISKSISLPVVVTYIRFAILAIQWEARGEKPITNFRVGSGGEGEAPPPRKCRGRLGTRSAHQQDWTYVCPSQDIGK